MNSGIRKLIHNVGQSQTLAALRYSLYLIVHPFAGVWDLIHEKKGSVKAAHILVFLVLVTRLVRLRFTGFMFLDVYWPNVSIWTEVLSILIPLLLFVVSNWGITTLFDGKGSFKNIYMSVAYALTPYILLQIPMVIMSNFVTADEGVFYYLMDSISLLWSGGLILSGLMKIHDYTMSKTVLSTLVSIVGMLAIALLCLILFSMFSEAIGYFVSLFQEIRIRIY